MRGFYYALVGISDDLSLAARYMRAFVWRVLDVLSYYVLRAVMGAVAWLDIRLVRLHTYCYDRAARLRGRE